MCKSCDLIDLVLRIHIGIRDPKCRFLLLDAWRYQWLLQPTAFNCVHQSEHKYKQASCSLSLREMAGANDIIGERWLLCCPMWKLVKWNFARWVFCCVQTRFTSPRTSFDLFWVLFYYTNAPVTLKKCELKIGRKNEKQFKTGYSKTNISNVY